MKRHPDLKLARRALRGDQEAWQQIYDTNRCRTAALFTKMLGYEEADDTMQDAFLQLHRKLHMYRGGSALSTFFYRICVNVALMKLRRNKVRTLSLDEVCDFTLDYEDKSELQIPVNDPRLEQTDLRLSLEWAIEELPDGQRQHLLLHDVDGLQHQEIAARLGCTSGNSKSQTAKARRHVRETLRGHPTKK